jgi:hypothetical protein
VANYLDQFQAVSVALLLTPLLIDLERPIIHNCHPLPCYRRDNLQPFLRFCHKRDMLQLLNVLGIQEQSICRSLPFLLK